MENEVGLWGKSLNEFSNLSVEVLKGRNRSVPPWLVNWLETSKGTVVSVSYKKFFTVSQCIMHVFEVKMLITICVFVPWSNPFSNVIMGIVIISIPNDPVGLSTVVKSILGSFACMHIHPYRYIVLRAGV